MYQFEFQKSKDWKSVVITFKFKMALYCYLGNSNNISGNLMNKWTIIPYTYVKYLAVSATATKDLVTHYFSFFPTRKWE